MKDEAIHGTEKEFIDLFKELTVSRSDWQVWSDLMAMMSCTISNVLDWNEKRRADREQEYKDCYKRLGGEEIPAMIFTVITQALDRDPDQDFLGKLYMRKSLKKLMRSM